MLLNKEILTCAIKEYIYDDCYYGEKQSKIKNIDELHDTAIMCYIGDDRIEEYDQMYNEMCCILNTDGKKIIDEINNHIDEEFQPCYMGEPAFASASDYWGYILG